MKRIHREPAPPAGSDLRRMIEPLANYICAADHPQRALMSALVVLFNELELTNRTAIDHFRAFSEN